MVELKEDKAMTFTEETTVNNGNGFSRYQHKAKGTAIYPQEHALTYLTLGLFGEAGELANKAKKVLRGDYEDKGAHVHEAVINTLMDECGDIAWYSSQLLLLINKDYGEVIGYDIDEYSMIIRTGIDFEDIEVEEPILDLGRFTGELCELVNNAFTFEDAQYIAEKVENITECLCTIALIHDRPFVSIFDNNLDKLAMRKEANTVKGDSRG